MTAILENALAQNLPLLPDFYSTADDQRIPNATVGL
jgi:hypothetical protein